MKKPQDYAEWLLGVGEKDELGLKLLITYEVLRTKNREIVDSAFRTVRDTFERALFEKGNDSVSIEFSSQNDVENRAKELIVIIDTRQGATLEQFSGVIYSQAKEFYDQVEVWENKSLWQYIKWWFKHRIKVGN